MLGATKAYAPFSARAIRITIANEHHQVHSRLINWSAFIQMENKLAFSLGTAMWQLHAGFMGHAGG